MKNLRREDESLRSVVCGSVCLLTREKRTIVIFGFNSLRHYSTGLQFGLWSLSLLSDKLLANGGNEKTHSYNYMCNAADFPPHRRSVRVSHRFESTSQSVTFCTLAVEAGSSGPAWILCRGIEDGRLDTSTCSLDPTDPEPHAAPPKNKPLSKPLVSFGSTTSGAECQPVSGLSSSCCTDV